MIRERRSVAGGLVALGVLSLVCLAGCGTAVEEDLGTISVALQAGSGGPTVTRIHADIAPGGVGLDLTYDAGSGTWRGSVVTTAGAKTIDATAYAGAVVVGTGTASLTLVQHGNPIVAMKVLDSTSRPAGVVHGPIVTSVSASTSTPLRNAAVNLSAGAVDPDAAAISYFWSDDCGGIFSSTTVVAPTWQQAAGGPCHLSVTVTSQAISVAGPALTINVDRPPVVLSVTPSATRVAQTWGMVTITAVASDPDGDALSYGWTSDCAVGGFFSPTSATTNWNTNAAPGATCHITVTVTARGVTATGATVVVVDRPPVKTWQWWSTAYPLPGGTVSFAMGASDPEGDAITYSWADTGCGGTFSAPTSSSGSTDWVAPPVAVECNVCGFAIDSLGAYNGLSGVCITMHVDRAPVVTSVSATDYNPLSNTLITLGVVASDPDGQAITYSWYDDCGGTFTNPTAATTTWQRGAAGVCQIRVFVSDPFYEGVSSAPMTVTVH